jgi:hypothetical protein
MEIKINDRYLVLYVCCKSQWKYEIEKRICICVGYGVGFWFELEINFGVTAIDWETMEAWKLSKSQIRSNKSHWPVRFEEQIAVHKPLHMQQSTWKERKIQMKQAGHWIRVLPPYVIFKPATIRTGNIPWSSKNGSHSSQ